MYKGNHRACSETDVFEAEPDIQQHADRSQDHGHSRVSPHFRAYSRADVLRSDFFSHAEFILHICRKCFTLVQIQCLCLKYYLICSLNSLNLNIIVACDIFQVRDHLAVYLIQSIFFVKCNCRRCTACKVKTVIHSADAARMVDAHSHEAADTQQDRNNKEYFSLSKEVDGLSRSFDPAVYFRIPDSQRIE